MNTPSDPLAGLKPIHLPAEPSWWPPGPGWWLTATVLLLGAIVLGIWWRRRQRRVAPRRAAECELNRIESIRDPVQQMTALNQLLRRAARLQHGADIAALSPRRWAAFLASKAPEGSDPSTWDEIAQAAYRPAPPVPKPEYLAWGRAWLRHNL